MPITPYLANAVLNHMLRNQAFTPPATLFFSIHNGDPSNGSTNEMAVTRVAGSYSAAVNGSIALSATVAILNCPTGTVKAWSIWDSQTNGNCLYTGWLSSAPKAFSGDLSTDLVTCPAHGLVADDQVVFYDDGLGTLPTGISEATPYYVIASGLTTDVFKISTSLAGAAVEITGNGQGYLSKISPKIIANNGDTFNLTAAPISIAPISS